MWNGNDVRLISLSVIIPTEYQINKKHHSCIQFSTIIERNYNNNDTNNRNNIW